MRFQSRTIFLTISGSQAYGMATSTSDVDVRGVYVADLATRLRYTGEKFDHFKGLPASFMDQARARMGDSNRPDSDFADSEFFDVVKAIKLIADNNPNMIELLWAPTDRVVFSTTWWDRFVEVRDRFLTTRCRSSFMGYAMGQYLKIKSHRSWLLNPPKKKPERADFDLPETSLLSSDDRNRIEEGVAALIRSWQIEDILHGSDQDVVRERMIDFWGSVSGHPGVRGEALDDVLKTTAARMAGVPESTVDLLSHERRYRAALKNWNSYLKHKEGRNPARAELEAKYGFDTKHASHLIRLARMAVEIVRDRQVNVRREDAEELLAIRRGSRTFEDIESEFRELEKMVKECPSSLPESPDHELINRILFEVLQADIS